MARPPDAAGGRRPNGTSLSHSEEQLEVFARWEREAWETRAAPYVRGLTRLTSGAVVPLLDAAGVDARTRVLDVATGPGLVAAAARDRGAGVVAVDQSRAMAGFAHTTGLPVVVAGAERLPFAGDAFDAVVAGFLLNHLARPPETVVELARVCRNRIALSVWAGPHVNVSLGLFGEVVESLGLPDVVPPGPESDRYASDERLVGLLRGCGLRRVHVTRASWTVTVEPGAWFDDVAAGTPRTGAVLAAAPDEVRAELRARYVEVATERYGDGAGPVTLPAAAVVVSGDVA